MNYIRSCMNQLYSEQCKNTLLSHKICVAPTDTLFGVLGSAKDPEVVEKIYTLKKRGPKKPLIILIHTVSDMKALGVSDEELNRLLVQKTLKDNWPGEVSIIVNAPEAPEYLHRGGQTLAFRTPKSKELQTLLKETGPLVAPSANPEGLPPARNKEEAEAYFGDAVSWYEAGETTEGSPSTILDVTGDELRILR